MKIGILTYHFVSNFGANLQTLSTFCYLNKSGHIPIIINWIPEDLENYYETVVPKEQNDAFHRFAKNHYTSLSRICRNSNDIAKVIDEEKIDMVIIGSDAVLTYVPIIKRIRLSRKGIIFVKPYIDSDFPNAFWGDFLLYTRRDIKLVLMSASAQNTKYSAILFHKKKFQQALRKFSYISVRDIWTKKMIAYLTDNNLNVKITPDPVFAFNYNVECQFSKDYIIKKYALPKNYALLSITNDTIGEDWKKDLYKEFSKNGITLYELPQANKKNKHVLPHFLTFPIDPIEWYCLIKYSKGYIGELMHPILVALHNSIPVYAIDTYGFPLKKGEFGIDPESSKTYQIIRQFDLLQNYWNINSKLKISQPTDIASRILSFDKEQCAYNALKMYQNYKQMLNEILSL